MFNPKGKLYRYTEKFLNSIREEDTEIVTKREYRDGQTRFIKYINFPCAFDIEVSSFRFNDVKCSCMYIWQFGINGSCIYGRTWEEFKTFIEAVKAKFKISLNKRLVVYVHNLGYEFQFIRDLFEWESIFAREQRQPMYARTKDGIEFRCSYALSGSSLEQTAKDLTKYKCKKLVGFLDYEKIRTPKTPLTRKEIDYCIYDVYCVMNYIKEEIERFGDITKIPMTKTGKVRLKFREECFSDNNKTKYRDIIKNLKINDLNEYKILKRAFQGGFTHASCTKANTVWENVGSCDFTSSYPAVMLAECYPMSTGQKTYIKTVEEFEELSKSYCIIANVHFYSLKEKFKYEHFLSLSKCWRYNENNKAVFMNEKTKNIKPDNGRIIEGEDIYTTITSVDWVTIKKVYDLDGIDFGQCYIYKKGYLPTQFVKVLLDLYAKKTTLKGVQGMEAEYMSAKADVNSSFGMCVTDIISDTITFENDWGITKKTPEDMNEIIEKYNGDIKRFLFYPWGVFITAYARRNLWTGIIELEKDYIYSDTDSVKYINPEKHKEYFNNYNKWIQNKLEKACLYHGFNVKAYAPKTIKGKEKPLGVWDDEAEDTPEGHIYARTFKTLGAKRYMGEHYNFNIKKWEIHCTIAGVNKKKTANWLNSQKNPFETFSDLMTVPEEYSGRMIVTYIDEPIDANITDYLGNTDFIKEHKGINMEKSEYNLTMSQMYIALLGGQGYCYNHYQ